MDIEIRDPADAWVLASAVAVDADLLVTGDRDLLDIAAQAPLRIVESARLLGGIASTETVETRMICVYSAS